MRKPLLLAAFFLCTFVCGLAQRTLVVPDLETALQIAVERQVSIQQAQSEVSISAKDIDIQRGGLQPSLRLTGQSDYYPSLPVQLIPGEIFGGPPGSFREVRFGQPWVLGAGLELSVPVLHIEKWLEIRSARQQQVIAQQSVSAEAERIRIQVAQAFRQALFWQAYLQVCTEQETLAASFLQAVDDRAQADLISPLDRNRADRLVQQVHAQRLQTEARLEQSKRDLAYYMGLPGDTELVIGDTLVTADYILRSPPVYTVSRRAQWQLAAEQTRLAILQSASASRNYLPVIQLTGRYNFQWQTGDLFDGSQYIDFRYGLIGLSLQWPIYQGGALHARRERSRLAITRAELRQQSIAQDLQKQLDDWQRLWQEAARQIPPARKQYDLARDNIRIAALRYEEGLSPIDEYFQVYQEYVQSAQQYYQQLLNETLYHTLLSL